MPDALHSSTLQLTAQPAAIAAASAWAHACAAEHDLDADDRYRLDLCINEWVENVIHYAYPARTTPGSLTLACAATAEGVSVTVTDTGFPFDPLILPSPKPPDSLTTATPGGLGVHLIRKFADACSHQRDGDRNVLTIEIHRRAAASNAHTARGVDRRRATDTATFPLERDDGIAVATEQRAGPDRRTHGFISGFRIFHDVPYAAVENVLGSCQTREFSDGEVLLRPGDRNEYLALVLRGRLRIHLDAPDSDDFVELAPGDCAGEMSLVDGRPVSAYVVAQDGCSLLLVDGRTFLTRLLTLPGVARNMLSMLAERMRSSNARALARAQSSLELAALQRELRLAHEIQSGMIPQHFALAPARTEVDCAGFMRAAREVGGDFYDAYYIEPGRLFVAIGDVCGKGVAAALLMVRTMMMLRAEASRPVQSQRQHTKTVMENVNRQLAENNENSYFASLFCGVLDTGTGVLTFANAGHAPPLVIRGRAPVSYLEVPRNPIAGILPGAEYTVGEIVLPATSTLLLYTDGLTEAENARGEMFGEARALDLLRTKEKRTAGGMVDDIVRTVDAFAGEHPQSDDLTLLVLVFHGNTAA